VIEILNLVDGDRDLSTTKPWSNLVDDDKDLSSCWDMAEWLIASKTSFEA